MITSAYDFFRPYIDEFETSRPIFALSVGHSGINARVADKYKPKSTDDVLQQVARAKFIEYFDKDKKKFVISKESIERECVQHVISAFRPFLEKNMLLKNPRKSKLWRWFYHGSFTNSELRIGLVLLYKYIYSVSTTLEFANKNSPHLNNILVILEAMKEKYEQEDR